MPTPIPEIMDDSFHSPVLTYSPTEMNTRNLPEVLKRGQGVRPTTSQPNV
jgi:hypothetical protein